MKIEVTDGVTAADRSFSLDLLHRILRWKCFSDLLWKTWLDQITCGDEDIKFICHICCMYAIGQDYWLKSPRVICEQIPSSYDECSLGFRNRLLVPIHNSLKISFHFKRSREERRLYAWIFCRVVYPSVGAWCMRLLRPLYPSFRRLSFDQIFQLSLTLRTKTIKTFNDSCV